MDQEEQFSIEFFYFAKALRAFVRWDNQQKKGSKYSSKERERSDKERRAFAWIRILLLSAGERISYETLERGEKKTKDDAEMCSLEKIWKSQKSQILWTRSKFSLTPLQMAFWRKSNLRNHL